MSTDWTAEELQMASISMKAAGNMNYEEFCNALHDADIITIKFNLAGKTRKELATAISEITGEKVVYKKIPTYAYAIGDITIDKEGILISPNHELANRVVYALAEKGFHTAERIHEGNYNRNEDSNILSIDLPKESLSDVALHKLDRIIEAKGNLIKKAIGADNLSYEITDKVIRFPWFKMESSAVEVQAYMQLISALAEHARNSKRITAKERSTDNEKYTFRCFLLRLGMIGDKYKISRKILLRNLKGNAAWKNK